MTYRGLVKVFEGEDKKEGAGVRISRIFDRRTTEEMDPFLMMDFFDSRDPDDYKGGFPWHPHRGIETITYILKGQVYHEDTLKNKGALGDGECQWMVSGNGIMHQELMEESEELLGVQIWLNMRAENKMDNPSYRDIRKGDIVEIEDGGAFIRLIAGQYKSRKGPVDREDAIDPQIVDVELKKGRSFEYSLDSSYNLFLFIVRGSGKLEGRTYKKGSGLLFDRNGEKIRIEAQEDLRFLLLGGRPIEEPIAWEGPIAMNTKEELDQAFDQLNRQEFISYRG